MNSPEASWVAQHRDSYPGCQPLKDTRAWASFLKMDPAGLEGGPCDAPCDEPLIRAAWNLSGGVSYQEPAAGLQRPGEHGFCASDGGDQALGSLCSLILTTPTRPSSLRLEEEVDLDPGRGGKIRETQQDGFPHQKNRSSGAPHSCCRPFTEVHRDTLSSLLCWRGAVIVYVKVTVQTKDSNKLLSLLYW
ncbi:PREDICTED: putative protein ATP11AUN [Mandrillus leucophaeus]|uniref:putative protein ATP11AUN n=1 Tax=Mandrillus leucophaeus TaxID=9568 RepID=UPI0005F43D18|nr:PREDICTED: putative protein ATP11AUN [Mandrillus leucophaeus]